MLNLYRRHREEGKCAGGHKVNLRSYQGDEGRRGWKKCACPIYVSGTLGGVFKRRNLEVSDWEQAKLLKAPFELASRWDALAAPPIAQNCSEIQVLAEPPSETDSNGVLVKDAIRLWLAEHECSAESTQRGYRQFAKELQVFADEKGYPGIKRFGVSTCRDFRDSWGGQIDGVLVPVKRTTSTKKLSALKAFFEFCVENEWLDRNPARNVKPAGEKEDEQRLPFTDEEVNRMLKACTDQYGKRLVKWDRDVHHCPAVNTVANYKYTWTGEDLADFITLSCRTGLRISDVATFHIDRLQPDGTCKVQAMKNNKWVCVLLPVWLRERVQYRAEKFGPLIFGGHAEGVSMDSITDQWRRKLNKVWALCEPWQEKPTPHRFRHTFIRYLLQDGVPVADVARLAGDTEKVIRKFYSAWMPEVQERLNTVMKNVTKRIPVPEYIHSSLGHRQVADNLSPTKETGNPPPAHL